MRNSTHALRDAVSLQLHQDFVCNTGDTFDQHPRMVYRTSVITRNPTANCWPSIPRYSYGYYREAYSPGTKTGHSNALKIDLKVTRYVPWWCLCAVPTISVQYEPSSFSSIPAVNHANHPFLIKATPGPSIFSLRSLNFTIRLSACCLFCILVGKNSHKLYIRSLYLLLLDRLWIFALIASYSGINRPYLPWQAPNPEDPTGATNQPEAIALAVGTTRFLVEPMRIFHPRHCVVGVGCWGISVWAPLILTCTSCATLTNVHPPPLPSLSGDRTMFLIATWIVTIRFASTCSVELRGLFVQ